MKHMVIGKFSLLSALVAVLFIFAACGGTASSGEVLVLKLSHVFSKGTPMDQSVEIAAKNIKERTNGAIVIQISSNGTLPYGADAIEQCVRGADFISLYDPAVMADWVPDYLALMGPFMVDTRDEFKRLCESDVILELNKKAEERGIKVLALPFNFGFRHIASRKLKVETPDVLVGKKFRVPSSQIFVETFTALGASTITTPSSEVYNAIQTGLADANESSIADLAQMQMQEVVKFISLTGHFIGTSSAVMSKKVFDKLTPEQQAILLEEFYNAAEYCSAKYAENEAGARKMMEDAGVEFVEVNKAPFIEATKVVYSPKVFPELSPDIYDRLKAEVKKIRGE